MFLQMQTKDKRRNDHTHVHDRQRRIIAVDRSHGHAPDRDQRREVEVGQELEDALFDISLKIRATPFLLDWALPWYRVITYSPHINVATATWECS